VFGATYVSTYRPTTLGQLLEVSLNVLNIILEANVLVAPFSKMPGAGCPLPTAKKKKRLSVAVIADSQTVQKLFYFRLYKIQAKKYTLGTDPKENTTSERTPKKIPPRTDQKENAPAA
jgi:hypothetical protein